MIASESSLYARRKMRWSVARDIYSIAAAAITTKLIAPAYAPLMLLPAPM